MVALGVVSCFSEKAVSKIVLLVAFFVLFQRNLSTSYSTVGKATFVTMLLFESSQLSRKTKIRAKFYSFLNLGFTSVQKPDRFSLCCGLLFSSPILFCRFYFLCFTSAVSFKGF